MSGLSLWKEDKNLRDWEEAVEKNEGEITPELDDWFNQIVGASEDKIESVGKYAINKSAGLTMLDNEIARLQAIKKSELAKLDRLKRMTLFVMKKMGVNKLDFGIFKISIAKNPPSCEIINEEEIPAKYFTIIPESRQLDKKRLLVDLKSGKVDGVKLITDKVNLRIK